MILAYRLLGKMIVKCVEPVVERGKALSINVTIMLSASKTSDRVYGRLLNYFSPFNVII